MSLPTMLRETEGLMRNHVGLRACTFCPLVMTDEHVALLNPEREETSAKLNFKFVWMAGGSSHKLAMFNEVVSYFPDLVHIEGLYPMGSLKRHGLPITKAYENPTETDGVVIATDKLDHYWIPFRDNTMTGSCRQHRYDAKGCERDHLFYASDVNVWANNEGVSIWSGGVFFRNPDEEIPEWFSMSSDDKKKALVNFIVDGYRKLGKVGNTTNMVETALAVRQPRGLRWSDDPVTMAGASRMFLIMPLRRLTDPGFIGSYVDKVLDDAGVLSKNVDVGGLNPSMNTVDDVLNSMGGAAGGILTEKLTQTLVENGDKVRISLPELHPKFKEAIGDRALGYWDQVRGHASGVAHVLTWTIFDTLSRSNFRPPRKPVKVRGAGEDFEPTAADAMLISKSMWKDK